MHWKDKLIVSLINNSLIKKAQTLTDTSVGTNTDADTGNGAQTEISFEELIKDQKLIGKYKNTLTEEQITNFILQYGLQLTPRSINTLLKTSKPLLDAYNKNKELVRDILAKNEVLRERFPEIWGAFRLQEYIPYGTPKFYLNVVKETPRALKDIPEESRTPEMYQIAVKRDSSLLVFMPDHLKTPQLYLEIVQNDCYALRDIPEESITQEMCNMAFEIHHSAIRYIPEHLQTPEMHLTIITQDFWYEDVEIPERLRTTEFYLAAIKQNAAYLKKVPKELKTPEFYLAAVKQNGKALVYVPNELHVPQLCEAAAETDATYFGYVPTNLRTEKMYETALLQRRLDLKDVPKELRTKNIYIAAIRNNHRIIFNLPEELENPEFYLELSKQCISVLDYLPKELRTPEFYSDALSQDVRTFTYIPNELRTPEMCRIAVTKNIQYLDFISKSLLTQEICLAAIKQHIPNTCSAFYKYFTIQFMNGLSPLHAFENSFFSRKDLLSMENIKKYHFDSLFAKFSSNKATELYKIFIKKKDLVDYKIVANVEELDKLNIDEINALYFRYVFALKQSELYEKYPEKMKDYEETAKFILDDDPEAIDELLKSIPLKSQIAQKNEILKHQAITIGAFTFEILDRADEKGLILGNLTGCCQKFGGENSGAVFDGFTNSNSNFLAVYDNGNNLIAQSWLRLGKPRQDPVTKEMKVTLYLDNIEANAPYDVNYEVNHDKVNYALLQKAYFEFGQKMKEKYNLMNVIVGVRYGDVIFPEKLQETPSIKEDLSDLTTDLDENKNYVIAKKLTIFKTNITKIAKGKRKL